MTVYMVAGIGTEVGKTVVSAILTTAFNAAYWKPIAYAQEPDHVRIKELVDRPIYPPAYILKAPLSPHHAARLEQIEIDPDRLCLPTCSRDLVVELSGGVLVPINDHQLMLDLFCSEDAEWILVSRHYLGSINHTLLTIEALRQRGIDLKYVVFNGESNPDTESAILRIGKVECLGRLYSEPEITPEIIQRYAQQWRL